MSSDMTRTGGVRSLRDRFDSELSTFLTEQRKLVLDLHPDLGPLVDEVVDLTMAPAKRLRPTFCYWGFRGGGGADGPEIVRACLALELLHSFALLHDDIMDGSRLRRGRPVAWLAFSDLHAREGWRGDAHGFGLSAAILAGDLALMWADALLAGASFPAQQVMAGFDAFTLMRIEVTAGQYLDLLEARRGYTDEAMARRVCELKSGRYTVERPLHIGLALTGGHAQLHEVFSRYGNPLGQAFQIRDDILGVFGEPCLTGKSNDDDLREGKETVLVAKAREKASPSGRRLLDQLLGSPDLGASDLAELRRVLVESGARAETEELVDELVAEAVEALDGAPLGDEESGALRELATYVGFRDR